MAENRRQPDWRRPEQPHLPDRTAGQGHKPATNTTPENATHQNHYQPIKFPISDGLYFLFDRHRIQTGCRCNRSAAAPVSLALPDRPTAGSASEIHEQIGMSGKDPHDIAPPEHPLIDMIGRRSLMRRKRDADRNSSTATREGTRTSEKHERLGQKRAFSVDLLIAYSKRLDLLSALVSAVKRLRAKDADESETGRNVRSKQAPRVWRVVTD